MNEAVPRVGVIEEEPTLLNLIALVLNRAGYWVEAIPVVHGGLELGRAEGLALVMVDLQMKHASPETIVGQLRQAPGMKSVPILALAVPAANVAEAGIPPGCTDAITKPFELRRLINVVDRLTGRGTRD